jgi:hypothetical protein
LRHELLAVGVPIDATHEVIHAATAKVLQCDMICSAWRVVIEFDGNRFHKQPSRMRKDERKTWALTETGWTVIRVHEALPTVGEHDVVVPLFSSELVRAKAKLEKLHSIGFTAIHYGRHLATEAPWATMEADAEVKRPITRSLPTELPDLAAEWDTTKNGVSDTRRCDSRKWTQSVVACPQCGHSWAAVVGSRARGGHGCPECARRATSRSRSTPKPGHSPAARFPDVAAQWHPTLYGELNPSEFHTRAIAQRGG